jgi:hypothetical protein
VGRESTGENRAWGGIGPPISPQIKGKDRSKGLNFRPKSTDHAGMAAFEAGAMMLGPHARRLTSAVRCSIFSRPGNEWNPFERTKVLIVSCKPFKKRDVKASPASKSGEELGPGEGAPNLNRGKIQCCRMKDPMFEK